MADTKNDALALIPQDAAQAIAQLVYEKPEAVYDELARTEKWLKDIKGKARQAIIKRMGVQTKFVIETDRYDVHATRHRPSILTTVVRNVLTAKGVDPALVVFKTVKYDPLPNAHDTLLNMLRSNIITKDEYDSMFDEAKIVVTTKPKRGVIDSDVVDAED